MSPYFLDAVRYARKVGYTSVQAATNGIEFAKSIEFCQQAAEAGLRYVYLQFDGIGNAANAHRKVGNLFDVKLRAIENLYKSGVDIVPVVTIVNGINNEQVGNIVKFALDNPKIIPFVSFQPVSFTGRDEEVTDDRRAAQRYTLSHLAHDVKTAGRHRRAHARLVPHLVHVHVLRLVRRGSRTLEGLGTALLRMPPELRRWHGHHGRQGNQGIRADHRLPRRRAVGQGHRLHQRRWLVQELVRGRHGDFDAAQLRSVQDRRITSPSLTFLKKMDKTFGVTKKAQSGAYGKVTGDRTLEDIEKRRKDRWNVLMIAGMWFQDLFNYDFRRTEQCIIPYATVEGEISFCAYNTGVGWRNIVEKMHMTATLTKWYDEHGRHEIFAGGKRVSMAGGNERNLQLLQLKDELVTETEQQDLDKLGIAKNAREEKRAHATPLS